MTLATDSDLEARLGRSLTSEEAERVDALLVDVSGSVQIHTGQRFERADYTFRSRVKRGFVRLPQRPVHSVDTVTDRFENDVEYEWDGMDRVYVTRLCPTGLAPLQIVDVTYDAGPDEVPEAIVGVVCNIALRTLGVDPTGTGISQESIDGYAYTIGSVGGAGAYGVLPAEAGVLASFRRPLGAIKVAW